VCFFDDSPSNVDAARSAGMRAYLTRGVQAVELALLELVP